MWLDRITTHLLNRLTERRSPPPAGIPLGWTTEPPHRRVVFPDRHRCEHAVILGKTGSGKTHLLEVLALEMAKRGEGFALIDFHGDVSQSLIARLRRLDQNRLVVLDPSHPTLSPGLNVLEVEDGEAERFRKVSEISSILRQRWGVDSFGARTEELLRNSLYTLAANRRTLADLPRFLTDGILRHAWVEELADGDIRTYWQQRFEPLSEAMKAAFREPLLNRVTAFLAEPAARHLLAQTQSTVHLGRIIERRGWLFIRLPKGRLREHAHTLGNLLFAQLQFAILARERLPPSERHTFTLLCDEAQNLQENDLGTILTEGRKFGVSLITANQFWEQMPRELRGALLSANSLICFRLSHQDASVLGSELSAERRHHIAAHLTGLMRGHAFARLGPGHLVHLRVPALPATPVLEAGAWDALLLRHSRRRTDIEAERNRMQVRAARQPRRIDIRQGNEGFDGW